jgi:hypothetical protein
MPTKLDCIRAVAAAGIAVRAQALTDKDSNDCAPEDASEQPDRDWRRYAERATAYAFGVAGDVKLAQGAADRERQRRREREEGEEKTRLEEATREMPRLRLR